MTLPPPARDRAPGRSPAIFTDRDGTLGPDLHYLREAERFELFRGVGGAIRRAHEAGFLVICVTNQSGIERGLYTAEDVERIHDRVNQLLRASDTRIDAFYYCPHAPESHCACRKPGTLLFEQAQKEWDLELPRSAIIGDRKIDIEAGRRLGLWTALVPNLARPLEEAQEFPAGAAPPDLRAESFADAVARILSRSR
jgi:D-glycero-D-manno-heptose 1,7-bisphosphate phosphatase